MLQYFNILLPPSVTLQVSYLTKGHLTFAKLIWNKTKGPNGVQTKAMGITSCFI